MSRARIAAFVGAASMTLGVVGAVNQSSPLSGVFLFAGGFVGYPNTRALLESELDVEMGTWTATALFGLCWLASLLAFALG